MRPYKIVARETRLKQGDEIETVVIEFDSGERIHNEFSRPNKWFGDFTKNVIKGLKKYPLAFHFGHDVKIKNTYVTLSLRDYTDDGVILPYNKIGRFYPRYLVWDENVSDHVVVVKKEEGPEYIFLVQETEEKIIRSSWYSFDSSGTEVYDVDFRRATDGRYIEYEMISK